MNVTAQVPVQTGDRMRDMLGLVEIGRRHGVDLDAMPAKAGSLTIAELEELLEPQ